ncbi:hypothetical protein FHS31_002582 [Sphingomonas vulcanisoli]|uniref:Ice-binding protein C-terminal domain-containing protein n=1 Tax=Sphingomonas vulcanisoli TaxID=1658060 RepID=A0ABX0TX00_9SPHN|nr:PEPxxWA-CTERM sorting domain-containing protein [Sphingomonas vulcanisoli]NIJ08952.1 hypothetical protein [Sphingomonas vulcanisoli]
MLRHFLAAAVLAAVATPALQAATTTVMSGSGIRALQIAYYSPVGQSFISAGTELTSFGFDFQTFNQGQANTPVTLTLRSGDGLTGAIVASRTMTLPTIPYDRDNHWYDFDFTGTALTAGATYTALLSTSSSLLGIVYGPDVNIYTGAVLGGDAYTGGEIVTSQTLSSPCAAGNNICDTNFRFTTTGDAAAVPEPASWAMMVGGFALLGATLRRRRATATFA